MAEHFSEPPKKKHARGESVFNALYPPLLTAVIGGAMIVIVGASLPHMTRKAVRGVPPVSQTAVSQESTTENSTSLSDLTTTTTATTAAPVPSESVNESLVIAKNAVLMKLTDAEPAIIFDRDADQKMYPASMTKIMTLLTFRGLVSDDKLDETIQMDAGVIAEQQAKLAYVAGFQAGENCRIRDLVYAMMLPSGADAAVMLATYAAGSEAAFAEKMNEKAAAMGLTNTHFDNCTGLHEDTHTSSVCDIAKILAETIKDPFCKEVMSTLKYTTAATEQHPQGIELVSTTLSRLVGNELDSLPVPLHLAGGKTGFTNPAGQCLATWAENASGSIYLCVIGGSTTHEPLHAMGDILTLYQLTSMPAGEISRIQPAAENLPDYVHY